ncbi:hypothetical protein GJ496_001487 [Pomphorhynchus laevis]|nr:hypothetical protein GJ496_001487 [Pomphorhynchus laevis]
MVGDGINDAIALRAANVGISIGSSKLESEVSDANKEAADVILLNDNLLNVVDLIEEGKCIFSNIQNFLRFQLSTSVSALCIIAFGTLLSRSQSPLNAMQILWINIIMDGPPAQSLGVEPADSELFKKHNEFNGVATNTRMLDKCTIIDILARSALIVIGTLFVFLSNTASLNTTKSRQTTLTFTCFVFFDMFNSLTCRSKHRPIHHIGFLSNSSFCAALLFSLLGQCLVIYWAPLQYVFQTESLSLRDILKLTFISSSVFFISEIYKYYTLYHAAVVKSKHCTI